MAYVDWMIKGPKIASCNCDYGCPCEFNAPPTHDVCEGLEAMEIEEGYLRGQLGAPAECERRIFRCLMHTSGISAKPY